MMSKIKLGGLLEESDRAVIELKSNYDKLTVEEAKQIISKVSEIKKSLGRKKDTTTTYNSIIEMLNDIHDKSKNINVAIEDVLKDEESAIRNTLTIENVEKLFVAINSKSQENVIEVLIEILDETQGTATLKQKLTNIKSQVKDMRSKLAEIETLDEEAIIFFSDIQKQGVSKKIEEIEKEYINFAKKVINNHVVKYLDVLVERSKELSVDEIIDKLNDVLDYYDKCKATIDKLKSENFVVSNLMPQEKNVVMKVKLLVILDFIDLSDYGQEFIKNNFSQEIGLLKKYVLETAIDYVAFVDTVMKEDVASEVRINKADIAQSNIKNINIKSFNTLEKVNKLKTRIEKYVSDDADMKVLFNQGVGLFYNIYYNNILASIETIMSLESEKQDKKYELDLLHYKVIIPNFILFDELEAMLGIPSNTGFLTAENLLNRKFKTGSTFTIKLSDNIYQTYTSVVLGDVYADGVVDARDYMAVKNYIMEKDELDATRIAASNTYRDDVVNARDYMKIKNQIMEKDTISL